VNGLIVRSWLVGVFLVFFTVQSIAGLIESEAVNTHDQIHHQLEVGHDESNHDDASHEGNHHVHLCHHHHGEHSAKVLVQAPDLSIYFDDANLAIPFSSNYENVSPITLFRPPIS
jgi:hypothetical protein